MRRSLAAWTLAEPTEVTFDARFAVVWWCYGDGWPASPSLDCRADAAVRPDLLVSCCWSESAGIASDFEPNSLEVVTADRSGRNRLAAAAELSSDWAR